MNFWNLDFGRFFSFWILLCFVLTYQPLFSLCECFFCYCLIVNRIEAFFPLSPSVPLRFEDVRIRFKAGSRALAWKEVEVGRKCSLKFPFACLYSRRKQTVQAGTLRKLVVATVRIFFYHCIDGNKVDISSPRWTSGSLLSRLEKGNEGRGVGAS